ncbi:MAG: hypothetical protein ACR2ML_05600 [Solirubrobacteraceae bacterium]
MPASPTGHATTTMRAELARLAARAAKKATGVVRLSAGTPPVHVTNVNGQRLEGVSVVAAEPGRYEVTVCLVALPAALPELAEEVRERVREGARIAGLGDALGPIAVRVQDVVTAPPAGPAP